MWDWYFRDTRAARAALLEWPCDPIKIRPVVIKSLPMWTGNFSGIAMLGDSEMLVELFATFRKFAS